jgi:L-idonate 5-dehydrogenase
MRAVVLHGGRDLRVEARDAPPLAQGRVRVRFRSGGICGSDLHYFLHGRTGDFVVTEPLVLGHEVAGEIVEIAGEVRGLAVGERVAVNPSRPCGECPRCREGRENICENVFFMGSASRTPHMQGGFAELVDVHPSQCFVVPQNVPFEHAALAEPLAVCLHAAARAGEIEGRRVLVTGAGPIGLLIVLACRWHGAGSITVTDVADAPLERAQALKPDRVLNVGTDPEALARDIAEHGAYDVAFEASGNPKGLQAAIEAVRRGGVVVQVGNLPGGLVPAPANRIMAREIDLRGSMRFGREFAEAVDLIVRGEIDVAPLITAKLPIAQAPEAFELAADRSRSVKVVLTA